MEDRRIKFVRGTPALFQNLEQGCFEDLVAKVFFFLCKMDFAELFGIVFVAEFFVAELLGSQVENAVAYYIIAMVISARTQNTENFSAKNVLNQKCRYGALSQSLVFGSPIFSKTGGTSVRTPDFAQEVIEVARIFNFVKKQ